MNRIYVSKSVGVFLIFIFILVTSYALLFLYQAYSGKTLINPLERLSPIGKTLSNSKKVQQVAGEKNDKEGKNKLTIIFFYDGYDSQQQALLDVEIMKKAFELVEPFKNLQDKLAYKVFTTDEKKCRVENSFLVCEKELIESFRALGTNQFKVVLMSQENFTPAAERARGRNSWLSISTRPPSLDEGQRKSYLGFMVTRLLGNSLGLAYESGEKTIEPTIPEEALIKYLSFSGRPNCAPDLRTAEEWWGSYKKVFPNIGYFQGCGGNKNYYFPQEGTLMSLNPSKESFGQVSEDYLRGVLTCFYGQEDDLIFPAGKEATYSAQLDSCSAFTSVYPNFWNE